jgi:glycosyltransferase involved in cell wall biosynthesis
MKNDQPTVAVVIPAYNEEYRISKALNSVFKQTRLPDEIIVVDDGSIDRTSEIVKKFGEQVTYIYQENQGLAAARNTGILHTHCEFIAFLDADDEWFSDHLHEGINVMTEIPNVNWFCAAFERRAEDGKTLFISQIDNRLVSEFVITDYFGVQAEYSFSCPSMMIVRRRIFDEVGLFDVSISQFGEDLDMWFRVALLYPEIGYSPKPGGIYWCRTGSITSGDKIDIPRFIRRIGITERAAIKLGPSAVQKSSRLTVAWLTRAVSFAVKQHERETLKIIYKHYGERLTPKWRFVCNLLQNRFFFGAAIWFLKLNRKFGGMN